MAKAEKPKTPRKRSDKPAKEDKLEVIRASEDEDDTPTKSSPARPGRRSASSVKDDDSDTSAKKKRKRADKMEDISISRPEPEAPAEETAPEPVAEAAAPEETGPKSEAIELEFKPAPHAPVPIPETPEETGPKSEAVEMEFRPAAPQTPAPAQITAAPSPSAPMRPGIAKNESFFEENSAPPKGAVILKPASAPLYTNLGSDDDDEIIDLEAVAKPGMILLKPNSETPPKPPAEPEEDEEIVDLEMSAADEDVIDMAVRPAPGEPKSADFAARVQAMADEIKKLRAERVGLETKIITAISERDRAMQAANSASVAFQKMRQELEDQRKKMSAGVTGPVDFRPLLAEKEKEIQRLRSEVLQKQAGINELLKRLDDASKMIAASKAAPQSSQPVQDAGMLAEKLRRLDLVLRASVQEREEQEKRLAKLSMEFTVSKKRIAELEGDLREKSAEVQNLMEELQKYAGESQNPDAPQQ